MTFASVFFITLLLTVLLMYWVWVWAVKIENFSIVDAVWAAGFTVQTGLYFYFSSSGYWLRQSLLFFMVAAWSIRLSYYLIKRISRHHPHEDTRYVRLRQEYGQAYRIRFLRFFLLQAVSISLLTLPFVPTFFNPSTELAWFDWIAVALFVLFLIGESLADAQMNTFKSYAQNKGQVCNVGLWKYSRHPNYFFEFCIWCSFYIFNLGSHVVWGAYAPLVILFLLLKVTGVPPSEAQSLKSRGDLYRDYQKKTSVFIPWWPKAK